MKTLAKTSYFWGVTVCLKAKINEGFFFHLWFWRGQGSEEKISKDVDFSIWGILCKTHPYPYFLLHYFSNFLKYCALIIWYLRKPYTTRKKPREFYVFRSDFNYYIIQIIVIIHNHNTHYYFLINERVEGIKMVLQFTYCLY